MANRTWTRIKIGGVLPENMAGELAESLAVFEGGGFDDAASEIAAAFAADEPLHYDGNVKWATPEEVTELCREIGLTYTYDWESGGEFGSGGAYWAPGMDGEASYDSDYEGRPCMYVDSIRERLADGTLAEHLDRLKLWAGERDFPPLTKGPARSAENTA